jgi:hypothetical protein
MVKRNTKINDDNNLNQEGVGREKHVIIFLHQCLHSSIPESLPFPCDMLEASISFAMTRSLSMKIPSHTATYHNNAIFCEPVHEITPGVGWCRMGTRWWRAERRLGHVSKAVLVHHSTAGWFGPLRMELIAKRLVSQIWCQINSLISGNSM